MAKDKERTKTHRERTVELNDRAAAAIERQRARTQLQPHGRVFATAGEPSKPWHDEQLQWRAWVRCLRRCGVRYRPPKEARDTSVTMALQAGCDPVWVAAQHGHSLQVMMRDYARWIPKADRGRNLAAVNRSLGTPGSELTEGNG
jgi:integrase